MPFSLKNSKMYVINLDSDENSMNLAKNQFQHHNITVERFSAIDGSREKYQTNVLGPVST
jgi:GR25 family glycosyltransferase involved in LPS biosynthesis